MDRIDKFTVAGIYSPTFFKVGLNTDDNIEHLFESGISERGEASFLHEYIHFLQDITTNSGLSNICRNVDYLKCINEIAKTANTLSVPYLPEDNKYNVSTNFELAKIYSGSSKTTFSRFTDISLKSKNVIIENDEKEVNSCVINLIGNRGEFIEYVVGEYAISESMAYCIENILYKGVLETPDDYPYNTVKIVAEHICPNLCDNPLNIIALCDACLMYFNPGEILFKTLTYLANINYRTLTPEDIYDKIIEIHPFEYLDCNNPVEIFDLMSPTACKQINDYFTTEIFDANKQWITKLFYAAYQLKVNKPYFMIDIARMGEIKNNPILMYCLIEIGCPVILNKEMDRLVPIVNRNIDNQEINPSCFWTINQIYSIFSKSNTLINDTYKCEMIEWCRSSFSKQNIEDLTRKDDCCRYAPWERALNEEDRKYCSFAHVWFSWGMKDLQPVNKK